MNQEHYKNHKSYKMSFDNLKAKFLESFPDQQMFVEKMRAQRRMNAVSQLNNIISLSKLYSHADFLEALDKCMQYNVFNHSFISGYLEKNHKQSFRIEPAEVNTELPKDNIKRDLSQYKMF